MITALFGLLLLIPIAAGDPPGAALDHHLALTDTLDPESGTALRTGTFRVWEDREARTGRVLELELVVLPATGPDPAPEPVFFLAGGPGQSALLLWPLFADWWVRERHDVVFMSQRGTGGNNRLACDMAEDEDDLQAYLAPMFLEQRFRKCLDDLSPHFDLTQYSTCHAADDLNDVRQALGYDRINLVGSSYGTRMGLVYMRRHADTVRTATLTGLAPLAFTNPLFHASEAQRALDIISDECAADADCAAAFPDVTSMVDEILARLREHPARLELQDPRAGRRLPVVFGPDAFAEALRVLMYYESRDIPLLVGLAHGGDYSTFAQVAVQQNMALRDMLAFGMLLSVTCAEDLDRIEPASIARLTEDTFLGDGRVRRQLDMCDFWPRSALPEGFGDPVTADVPTLILSGFYDPVTSPRQGAEAARHLPDALHVVVPGSHSPSGECIDDIRRRFLEAGTVEGLDTSCLDGVDVGPFRLPATPPAEDPADEGG